MTTLQKLTKANPVLIPNRLSKLFPDYQNFIPLRESYGLWLTPDKYSQFLKHYGQYEKVLLLISGVPAGGKDAVREMIEELMPGLLFKAITATSRKIRADEKDGKDYYFYKDKKTFMKAVKNNEFIEWIPQGNRLYGMPKKSLDAALSKPGSIVCSHVEMKSGWPKVEDYIKNEFKGKKPFILKVFVMPQLKFSQYINDWLPQKRKDAQARTERSAWEISVAAKNAHFILVNNIRDDGKSLRWEAKALINQALKFLKPGHGFKPFATPFKIKPGKGGVKHILSLHNSALNKQTTT